MTYTKRSKKFILTKSTIYLLNTNPFSLAEWMSFDVVAGALVICNQCVDSNLPMQLNHLELLANLEEYLVVAEPSNDLSKRNSFSLN